jgi:predicted metal-dependent hydrolase
MRMSRHHSLPAGGTVSLGGQSIPYTIRVSARARILRLVVRQESGLEIVVPHGVRSRQIEEALHRKASWILKSMRRLQALPELRDGRELSCMGQLLRLQLSVSDRVALERPRVTLAGEILLVTLRQSDQNNSDVLRRTLEGWFRRRAHTLIPERLMAANQTFGFRYGRVTIKEQKSRWGSCSRAGNLNFNWRLLMAPLPVLDYVLIHELAHLQELNHAPAFWQLVASACPDYQTQRRWLREHGHTLRF